jgi:trimeric autotransporter adhesin
MKREGFLKMVLIPVLSVLLLNLPAQVPHGFNFQGVARNSGGELLVNSSIDLKIGVIALNRGETVWEETHSVTTNEIGLFNLVIGNGTRTAGTVDQFLMINWGIDKFSLKVQLDAGNGYEDMGTTELQSVPYAMVAGTLTSIPDISSLGSLDIIQSIDQNADSAIFTVRNKDGNIVFAVYDEGVRINVADYPDVVKGKKGGFAIGGFGATKGETNEYLRVTPDSVRVYVDETISKGKKGGFAIGGFGATKGITDFLHLTPDNYFIGHQAGSAITSGLYNSFFGYDAGLRNTIGSNNVFIGNETGNYNVDGHWNIFVGNRAGFANTSGIGNIILGDEAGRSNTTGSGNVFLGDWAGRDNTIGESNVYIGADAGLSNLGGSYNVFLGSTAGYNNTEGVSNVFLGESSGYSNTLGESNVFIGTESGYSNLTGDYNVFMGEAAGWSNTIGEDNVFIGASAGELNKEGNYNVFMGSNSGSSNVSGSYNVFLGEESGSSNSEGISNVFLGKEAGTANTSGSYNVFLGTLTGQENTLGQQNVFLGQEAGSANITGNYNVAIGTLSGSSNISGSSNVFIGYQAGIDEEGSNRLYINNKRSSWDETLIYGEFDNDYLGFYANVEVAGDIYGASLNETSDKKFKTNILDVPSILNKVMALRPVTYDWNTALYPKSKFSDGKQFGLIAQEVETLFPELVKTNKKGDLAISYTKLSVLLLEAMKEQQAIIEELKAENTAQKESLQQLSIKVDKLVDSLK